MTLTELRFAVAANLGFSRIFIPRGTKGLPAEPGIEVLQVGRVDEVLADLFG